MPASSNWMAPVSDVHDLCRPWRTLKSGHARGRSVRTFLSGGHATTDTLTLGTIVTMVSAAIILSFTIMEFMDYRRIGIDTSVVVDRSRGEKLNVHLNMTFPRVPCYREFLSLLSLFPARPSTTDDRSAQYCPST
jgi:hypothetical protein